MPVLKQSEAAPLLNDPTVVLDLGDLRRQADRIIAAAEQEAGRILEAARAAARDEAERIRAEAEATGRVDGEAAGRAAGEERGRAEAMAAAEAQLDELQAAWTTALDDWSSRRASDLAAAREDVVALAVAIAERVVHRTIGGDPEAAVRQAAAAIELLSQARDVRIAVHPDDEAALREALPRLAAGLGSTVHVGLEADASLDRGGVVVRSGDGMIDARIGTQLRRIAEALVPGRAESAMGDAAGDAAGDAGRARGEHPAEGRGGGAGRDAGGRATDADADADDRDALGAAA